MVHVSKVGEGTVVVNVQVHTRTMAISATIECSVFMSIPRATIAITAQQCRRDHVNELTRSEVYAMRQLQMSFIIHIIYHGSLKTLGGCAQGIVLVAT